MGFGGECGNSRAARADGTHVWAWERRSEHLARVECDCAAHTTGLETADAVKWVHQILKQVPAEDRPRNLPGGIGGPSSVGTGRPAGLLFRESVKPTVITWRCGLPIPD